MGSSTTSFRRATGTPQVLAQKTHLAGDREDFRPVAVTSGSQERREEVLVSQQGLELWALASWLGGPAEDLPTLSLSVLIRGRA